MHARMVGALLGVAGCAGTGEEAAPSGEAPEPAPVVEAPVRTEPPPPPSDDPVRFAKVLEVMEGGGYTFARLDACGQEAWAAGPPTELKVGDAVSMPMGNVMTGFHSPTLGRTFDLILFVPWFRTIPVEELPSCEAPAPPSGTAAPGTAAHGGGGPRRNERTGPPGPDEWAGTILETMDSGGYTYVRMKTCTEESMWVAAPKSTLSVGQPVAASGGVPMRNFRSESLDRSFESILFAQTIRILPGPVTCD